VRRAATEHGIDSPGFAGRAALPRSLKQALAVTQPPMQWKNRPTLQQAVEIER
jgi:hypothetical protein